MKKKDKSKIIEILEEAALTSCADPTKPGVVVERLLRTPLKEDIQELTSDDLKDIRIDVERKN